MNTNMDEKVIFVRMKAGENGSKYVKKGDVVGTVSTIVEFYAEDERQEEEFWRLYELKEILDLEDLESDGRDKLLKMKFSTKDALRKGDWDI